MPTKFVRALVASLIALAAVVAGVTVTISDSPSKPAPVIVPTEDADGDLAPVVTTEKAVDLAEGGELHEGARSEQPKGVTPGELDAGREQQEDLAARDDLPSVSPLAAPVQAGCTTRLVRNYSSRRGVAPRIFVLHYTVSPNRPGWADVWGIVSLFDRASFAASSNYVIDDAGNCAYIVREADKAWTQAALNPVSISVEIIATGREGRLAGPAGITKIGRVASDSMKRWGIPLQMGRVEGCTVKRPGLVTHQMLGACGGGHVDISPYSPDVILRAAKAYRSASSGAASKAAAARGKLCNQLRFWRGLAKKTGWTPKRVQIVNGYKADAKKIGLDATKCKAR